MHICNIDTYLNKWITTGYKEEDKDNIKKKNNKFENTKKTWTETKRILVQEESFNDIKITVKQNENKISEVDDRG